MKKIKNIFILFLIFYLFFFYTILHSFNTTKETIHFDSWSIKKNISIQNFHIGRNLFKRKFYKKSIPYLTKFLSENHYINDYTLYYLGFAYFQLKLYEKAAFYLLSIQEKYPYSRFLQESIQFEALSYIQQKKYSRLIKQFKKRISLRYQESYLYYIGYSFDLNNQPEKALYYYLKLLKNILKSRSDGSKYHINSTWFIQVMRNISSLLQNYSWAISESNRLAIGIGYYDLNYYKRSLKIFESIKVDLLKGKEKAEYLYFLGKIHFDLKKVQKARFFFKKSISLSNDDRNQYILSSIAYYQSFKAKNKKQGIEGYNKITELHHHPSLILIIREMIDYYDTHKIDHKKAKWLAFLSSYKEYEILWKYFLSFLNRGELTFILTYFPKITDSMQDKRTQSQFYYWLGVIAWEGRQRSKAYQFFSQSYLTYRDSYYSFKSFLAIKKDFSLMKGSEIKESDKRKDIRKIAQDQRRLFFESKGYKNRYQKSLIEEPIEKNIRIQRALFFYGVGYPQFGQTELDRFFSGESEYKPSYYRQLGNYFYKRSLYQESIRFTYKLVKYLNGEEGNHHIPESLMELYYPKRYETVIESVAKKYGLERSLIYAVIREESRFNEKAISPSGARGLMQIMPRTGHFLAKKIKLKNYNLLNLFNPGKNIELGSFYLDKLIDRFNSNSYALAGYNGGPTRMSKWIKSIKSSGVKILNREHMIELIPIKETNRYVKKVLLSYYHYSRIDERDDF